MKLVPRDKWIDKRLVELSTGKEITRAHVNQAVAEKRAGDSRIAAWRQIVLSKRISRN